MIELFSFSTLSHFYADMQTCDQKYIARNFFKTHERTLVSWLRCCTELRNFCAHFGRLYFRNFPSIPSDIPELDKSNERSLFAVIMVLRNLYADSEKWDKEIYTSIYSLINEYKANLRFSCIGFPADWDKLLRKRKANAH
jgi:abortive infection bacteriophage resistance protein